MAYKRVTAEECTLICRWGQEGQSQPKSSPKTDGLFYERAFRPTLARRSGPPALQKHPRVGLDIVPWRATGLRRRVDTRVAWGVWQDGASLGDDRGQQ